MESYQKQYIEVQPLLDFLEKTKEILHDSQKACETLDLVKAKIDTSPKKIGTVLRIKQIIDKDDLLFCRTQEELDRCTNYVKEEQAKELGVYCLTNCMIETSVEQYVGPFHKELVQSEIEILTTDEPELNPIGL